MRTGRGKPWKDRVRKVEMYENEFGLRFNPFFWAAFIGVLFIAWKMYGVISGLGDVLGNIPPA